MTLGSSGADSDEEASATEVVDPYNAYLPTTFIPIARHYTSNSTMTYT